VIASGHYIYYATLAPPVDTPHGVAVPPASHIQFARNRVRLRKFSGKNVFGLRWVYNFDVM
jgi:hypothetical protein